MTADDDGRESMVEPDPSKGVLDVLASLDDFVDAADLDQIVRPLLTLVSELTGLESVLLTSIDWDAEEQRVEVAVNRRPDTLAFDAGGAAHTWGDATCRLSMERGWGHGATGHPEWDDNPFVERLGLRTYVVSPVHLAGESLPVGTLCAASAEEHEEDERIARVLDLFAGFVARTMERTRDLETANRRAQVAEQRLEERVVFSAKVEHAMRTPLALVRGWAATLVEGRLQDEDQRREGLAVVERNARRLEEQIDDLLEENRLAMRAAAVERTDVRALVEADVPPDWTEVSVDGELVLHTDPVLLGVVVQHLVENAVRHTDAATPVRVELSRTDDGGLVVVEDDGQGLPDRDDLFEAFVSADPVADRRGSGLGLHVVAELVAELGGDVAAGAADGGGARFEVRLPDLA